MDRMVKAAKNQKTFQDNAHNQSSKKVPLPQTKEYGTGLPYKKAPPALSPKKPVRNK